MSEIKPVLIKIGISKILQNEVGLFATRLLKKGTVVGEVGKMGESVFIKWQKLKNNHDKITIKLIHDFALGNPNGFYCMKDLNYLSMPWFMNHSCDGNVGFDKKDNFVTIKNVRKDEELVWDYGLGESNPDFKMKCLCGTKKCRKIITGNDWKDKDFFNKNKKNMLSDLIKLIG